MNYEKFDIKTLKIMYRTHKENCERIFARIKTEEAFLHQEVLERDEIERAMKKRGILPNQINIEEISEKTLTNTEI